MDIENSTSFPSLNLTGYAMFVGSIFMNIWNKFSVKNINEYVVLVTSIIALVFMLYKLILIHYELMEKRKEHGSKLKRKK